MLDLVFGITNLAIYFYISRAFGANQANLGGAPNYFAFAAVGVSLTVVLQAASLGLSQRLREEQLTGTLEALVAEPIASSDLSRAGGLPPSSSPWPGQPSYLSAAYFLFGLDLSQADLDGFIIMLASQDSPARAWGVACGAVVLVFKRGEALALLPCFTRSRGRSVLPTKELPSLVQADRRRAPDALRVRWTPRRPVSRRGMGADALVLAA